MPKYVPTLNDMYETKPCFICGRDVLDENTDTCSPECQQLMESYKEDLEWFQMKEIEDYDVFE